MLLLCEIIEVSKRRDPEVALTDLWNNKCEEGHVAEDIEDGRD
jgi:hypothetical protein